SFPRRKETDRTVSGERGRLARCATRLAGHAFVFFGENAAKSAESKAHKRPNLPCAWHFALYRFADRDLQLHLHFIVAHGTRLPRHPKIKEITNSTRNITNRSFAMPADAAAI